MVSQEGKEAEAKKPKKPTVKYIDLPIDDSTSSLPKTALDRAHEEEVGAMYMFICTVNLLGFSFEALPLSLSLSPPHSLAFSPGQHGLPGPAGETATRR